MSDPLDRGGAWQVRAYQDSDEAEVVALWQLCFPGDPARNEPRSVIQRKRGVQPELFLVGVLESQLVATAVAGYDGYRGWVYHVATHPTYRRRGLGRRLMAEVEQALLRLGCPKLNLQVRAQNREVMAFYRALGYQVEERVSMGKALKPPMS